MITALRARLGAKLVLAQLLVILAGSATLGLVAMVVGPDLFHAHVRDALGVVPDRVSTHLDQAFADAMLISLGIATAAATVTAVGVSAFLAVRMLRPITSMATAAGKISEGHYDARVPVAGTDELALLGRSFNEMARSLDEAEERRRRLISDVAHEFRTPLATVQGYLEAMRDEALPRSDENFALLIRETGRLGRLIDDLSTVSMAEERRLDLRTEPVAAQSLLTHGAQASALAFAEKGVALTVRPPEDRTEVVADAERMDEVLRNLLDNALRHTPAGGSVEMGTDNHGDEVRLWVRDSGQGIAPGDLSRVFERFYRVDRSRARASGGSGIGLTIARAIVEAHGGRLWAESAGRGMGSRFVIALPYARRSP